MKTFSCVLVLLAIVLAPATTFGATMRCNNGILSTGATTQETLDKCGAPSSSEKDSPNIDEDGFVVRGAALVEHWTYTPAGGIQYQLRFIDDRLVEIRSGR